MSVLFVGSMSIEKGFPYQGIIPLGNAFRLTEDIRISINRGPLAHFPLGTDIINHPDFTYSFEKKTVVILSRVVTPDLTIVYENASVADVPLISGVESASIVSVVNTEEIIANGGRLTAGSYVVSTSNQSRNITIRLYANSILVLTDIVTLAANESKNVVADFNTVAVIPADATNYFTLEADGADCEIKGSETASRIRLEKTTL